MNRTPLLMMNLSPPQRIALVYVLVAALWILLSDTLLALLVRNTALLTALQTYKGWLFVAVTGIGLYWLAQREFEARGQVEIERRTARQSVKLLETAMQQTLDSIVITDAHLERPGPSIVYVNRGFTTMTGYTADEVMGKSPRILQGPKTDRDVLGEMRRKLMQGEPFYGEMINYRKNGAEFYVESYIVPIFDEAGASAYFVAVQREITERRRAEEQIRYQAGLLQNVSDAIISTDLNLSIKSWNQAAEVIYGWSQQEVIGKSIAEVLGEEAYDGAIQDFIGRILEAGEWVGEVVQQRRDGATIHVFMSASLVHDGSGAPGGIVTINRDVTERKRAQAEITETQRLRVQIEEERELVELKERFISMVSHEFRTPLTVIGTSSDLIENYFDRLTPEKRVDHLRKIRTQTVYMRMLLDDVLTFSRGRAGKETFTPAPLDLDAFCRSLFEQMQHIDDDGHRYVFTGEGDFGATAMDERLLQHILVNLLSNAIKYSSSGSEVRFDLRREGDQAVFRISDQGIGIPAKDQERLFEPFHRADNAREFKGTGLGLAIVKNSVDAHSGSIRCESLEGAGTTFTVWLPLVSPTPVP